MDILTTIAYALDASAAVTEDTVLDSISTCSVKRTVLAHELTEATGVDISEADVSGHDRRAIDIIEIVHMRRAHQNVTSGRSVTQSGHFMPF